MRQKLRVQLIRHEGFVPHAYEDSLKVLTIGIGRMIDKRRGGGITLQEAEYLLDNDLSRVEKELFAALPWAVDLDAVRQDVLLNMAFNMGLTTLLTFKTTLKLVREGKYVEAAAAMLQSKWSRQVGKRSVELSEQMRLGKYYE